MSWLADLRVPAATTSLRSIRLLVGSVGSTLDLSVDAIEDLQMGAAECAALLLQDAGAGAILVIELREQDGSVEVRGSVDTEAPAVEIDELAELVLAGTVDSHELESGPGPRSFVIRKRRG
ncbi:MAG: hypothetical protein AAGA99_12795 [Actinomycetota bacterium]